MFRGSGSASFHAHACSKEPTLITVPTKNATGVAEESDLPVILPHDLLTYLMKDCGLYLEDEQVLAYWRHMEEVQDSWALSTQEFRAACRDPVWTLGLYGDEACMQINNAPFDKIVGIYLNVPLSRPKSSRLSRFLLCAVENSKTISAEATFFPILRALVDSCNQAAEEGVLGRRFLVSEIRGDQLWNRFLFQHKSWWKAANVCFRCSACMHPSPHSYMTNGSQGGWETTLRSTNEFVVEELPGTACRLLASAAERFSKVLLALSELCKVPTSTSTSST